MATNKPAILQDTEDTTEILASAILDVAKAARKLLSSRLTKRVVCLLIQDTASGDRLGMKEIERVLDAASQLDVNCLRRIQPIDKSK